MKSVDAFLEFKKTWSKGKSVFSVAFHFEGNSFDKWLHALLYNHFFITSFSRTPCKINPAVNTVLSARKPSREETPLKRLQDQQQQHKEAESGKPQEQSMYCKELLLSGATEFCFEELRAERHFKKTAQGLQEAGREESQAN